MLYFKQELIDLNFSENLITVFLMKKQIECATSERCQRVVIYHVKMRELHISF